MPEETVGELNVKIRVDLPRYAKQLAKAKAMAEAAGRSIAKRLRVSAGGGAGTAGVRGRAGSRSRLSEAERIDERIVRSQRKRVKTQLRDLTAALERGVRVRQKAAKGAEAIRRKEFAAIKKQVATERALDRENRTIGKARRRLRRGREGRDQARIKEAERFAKAEAKEIAKVEAAAEKKTEKISKARRKLRKQRERREVGRERIFRRQREFAAAFEDQAKGISSAQRRVRKFARSGASADQVAQAQAAADAIDKAIARKVSIKDRARVAKELIFKVKLLTRRFVRGMKFALRTARLIGRAIRRALTFTVRVTIGIAKKAVGLFTRTFKALLAPLRKIGRFFGGSLVVKILFILGIRRALRAMNDMRKQVIALASDSQEIANLFGVSMGKMTADAEKFAQALNKNLGVSIQETRKALGEFNVLLRSLGIDDKPALAMSKAMTQLALDLSSFFNIPIEDAFLKLRAGIVGEVEPLRKLGIVLLQSRVKAEALARGMVVTGQKLNEAQKITARFNLIMRDSAAAQGDLARTSHLYANALRQMQGRIKDAGAAFGRFLLPMFTDMVKKIRDLIPPADEVGTSMIRMGLRIRFAFRDTILTAKQLSAGIADTMAGLAIATLENFDGIGTAIAISLQNAFATALDLAESFGRSFISVVTGDKSGFDAINDLFGVQFRGSFEKAINFLRDKQDAFRKFSTKIDKQRGALQKKLAVDVANAEAERLDLATQTLVKFAQQTKELEKQEKATKGLVFSGANFVRNFSGLRGLNFGSVGRSGSVARGGAGPGVAGGGAGAAGGLNLGAVGVKPPGSTIGSGDKFEDVLGRLFDRIEKAQGTLREKVRASAGSLDTRIGAVGADKKLDFKPLRLGLGDVGTKIKDGFVAGVKIVNDELPGIIINAFRAAANASTGISPSGIPGFIGERIKGVFEGKLTITDVLTLWLFGPAALKGSLKLAGKALTGLTGLAAGAGAKGIGAGASLLRGGSKVAAVAGASAAAINATSKAATIAKAGKTARAAQEAESLLGKKVSDKLGKKVGGKLATKVGGKALGKLIPGVGIALSAIDTVVDTRKAQRGQFDDTFAGMLRTFFTGKTQATDDAALNARFSAPNPAFQELLEKSKVKKARKKLPRLAKGGIVKEPTIALIGEAGPEAVVPLERSGVAFRPKKDFSLGLPAGLSIPDFDGGTSSRDEGVRNEIVESLAKQEANRRGKHNIVDRNTVLRERFSEANPQSVSFGESVDATRSAIAEKALKKTEAKRTPDLIVSRGTAVEERFFDENPQPIAFGESAEAIRSVIADKAQKKADAKRTADLIVSRKVVSEERFSEANPQPVAFGESAEATRSAIADKAQMKAGAKRTPDLIVSRKTVSEERFSEANPQPITFRKEQEAASKTETEERFFDSRSSIAFGQNREVNRKTPSEKRLSEENPQPEAFKKEEEAARKTEVEKRFFEPQSVASKQAGEVTRKTAAEQRLADANPLLTLDEERKKSREEERIRADQQAKKFEQRVASIGLDRIPALAHGGIVKEPTIALIGEAGPEAVVPLERAGTGFRAKKIAEHLNLPRFADGALPSQRDQRPEDGFKVSFGRKGVVGKPGSRLAPDAEPGQPATETQFVRKHKRRRLSRSQRLAGDAFRRKDAGLAGRLQASANIHDQLKSPRQRKLERIFGIKRDRDGTIGKLLDEQGGEAGPRIGQNLASSGPQRNLGGQGPGVPSQKNTGGLSAKDIKAILAVLQESRSIQQDIEFNTKGGVRVG